jgi:putative membrane protein
MVAMMWSSNGPIWGGWITMTAGMLAFWALIFAVVIALTRGGREDSSRSSGDPEQDDPIRVLDDRFARGEIDLEDYQVRRALLSEPHSA